MWCWPFKAFNSTVTLINSNISQWSYQSHWCTVLGTFASAEEKGVYSLFLLQSELWNLKPEMLEANTNENLPKEETNTQKSSIERHRGNEIISWWHNLNPWIKVYLQSVPWAFKLHKPINSSIYLSFLSYLRSPDRRRELRVLGPFGESLPCVPLWGKTMEHLKKALEKNKRLRFEDIPEQS